MKKNITLVFVLEKSRCRESPLAWLFPLGSEVAPLVSHCLAGLREQDRTNATCTLRKGFSACTQSISLLLKCPDTTSECQKGSEGPQHPGSHHVPGARKTCRHGLGCTGFTHSSLAVLFLQILTLCHQQQEYWERLNQIFIIFPILKRADKKC